VVFLGHSAALSGAEIALVRLLTALRDIDPVVLLAEDGPLIAKLTEIGVPAHVVPLADRASAVTRSQVTGRGLPLAAVGASMAYTLRLAAILRRLKPDLVHTNSLKAHLYGGVAAAMAGIPQIWHARDRITPDYLPPPAVRVVRMAARTLPAMVVANSHCTLRSYAQIPAGEVVYNGVPAHEHPPGYRPPPPSPLRIGVVGRLSPWKGQDVFLRAFAAAFAGGTQRAVIIGGALFGEHEFERELRDLALRLQIAHQVEFAGFSDDVARRLEHLHVLVHCSTIPEPFGQVVVEGMAAGLPVVAADAGGPAEIVRDGQTGMLVAPGDVDALATTLSRLAADHALRERLGRAARAASRRWSPGASAARMTAVYQRVLDASSARRGGRPPAASHTAVAAEAAVTARGAPNCARSAPELRP
jgi:glycosyltransferase involved in cell wall biosynthesis